MVKNGHYSQRMNFLYVKMQKYLPCFIHPSRNFEWQSTLRHFARKVLFLLDLNLTTFFVLFQAKRLFSLKKVSIVLLCSKVDIFMAKLDVKKDFPFHPLFINITSLAQIFSNVEPLSYIHTQPEKICLYNSSVQKLYL